MRTWVAFERLTLNQIQTVYAKIVKGEQPVAGAKMYTIVHYSTQVDQRWPEVEFETTEANGIASVSFSALDAGSKKDVTVDVYLIYDETVFHTTTFFTTQC
ncbi:MAG: hypothetical protein JXA89_17605 [Anaerolineae bacterium]|nr:hypothetical protein [Anaerolineae bacterium]